MIKPEDIIEKFTIEELCQTADDYFKSMSNPLPVMAKPFNSIVEAPEILQNMGLLLSGLHIGKTMTVLEFAAGPCWFARYLNQLQCQTIACDVSQTALDIGKRLFAEYPIIGESLSEPLFLDFDGHKLNLPDESVDRIICNDGFHHVPNQEEVMSELARVLKPGGIAGFCEPGPFHSQGPQSQYEMRNFNVLENDIVITEIFALAQKHGFTDCRIKLLSNMDVSPDEWQTITDFGTSPQEPEKPSQTKQLMASLSSVLSRLGKRFSDINSQSTSGQTQTEKAWDDSKLLHRMSDNIRQVMTTKTIFFLHKGGFTPDSRTHIGLAHSISTDQDVYTIKAGEYLSAAVKVTNTGGSKWLDKNIHDIGVVSIGGHLYDDADNLLDLDLFRQIIPGPIAPGEAFEEIVEIKFDNAGLFRLSIDLVDEGICWFENIGSKTKWITIHVNPA